MVSKSSFSYSCLGKLDEFKKKGRKEEKKKKKMLNIVPRKTGDTLFIPAT